jgi:hypothetical protein
VKTFFTRQPGTPRNPVIADDTEWAWRCRRKGGTVISAERCKKFQDASCVSCENRKKGKNFLRFEDRTRKIDRRLLVPDRDEYPPPKRNLCAYSYSDRKKRHRFCPEGKHVDQHVHCENVMIFWDRYHLRYCLSNAAIDHTDYGCVFSSNPRVSCPRRRVRTPCQDPPGLCLRRR